MRIKIAGKNLSGYALMLVLFVIAGCLVVLSATMTRAFGNAKLNSRNNQYVNGLYAAEASTEKVIAKMKSDFMVGNLTAVTNNMDQYRGLVPLATESSYWSGFEFNDCKGHVGQNYVECTSSIGWGALSSAFGLYGWTNRYRILSNAKQLNTLYDFKSAVQQDVELDLIPVFQYAIFYNGLMEFTWCATLTVNGRTHANSNIFVGSASALTFNSVVTATGGIYRTNWAGHTTSEFTGAVNYNGSPGYVTNTHSLSLPIGTNNSAAAVREILNIPPAGESITSPMAQQRYYNKAAIVMLVTDTNVTAMIKNSISDTASNIVATYSGTNYGLVITNFPFLSLTNTFTDAREGKVVKASQLDMGLLKTWMLSNNVMNTKFPNTGGIYDKDGAIPNILYINDMRTITAAQMDAIRLANGTVIPTNMTTANVASGFTVATPNPLYTWGHYNAPVPAQRDTTNTGGCFPASLISDAMTILSTNWHDSASAGALSGRIAGSTTVNAAILTGIVYSTGNSDTTYSGGVMNLPRMLEDWDGSGTILTLNTSIVNLFNSVQATNQFKMPGVYYYAPWKRQFTFDINFLDYRKLPPGTPTLPVINRVKWAAPPAGMTNYAGNN
jgi:hypothetical protein